MIPYFIFAFLTYMLDMYLLHPDGASNAAISKQIYGIFYGNGNSGYLAFNVALWFLPCLFVSKVSLALLTRVVRSEKIILATLVLASFVGYAFSAFSQNTKLLFGIESALTAIVFLGAGYLWSQSAVLKSHFTKRKFLVLFASTVFTIIFAALNYYLYGHQIDMRLNRLNNYFFFYAGAFSGISICLVASMIIKKNALLEYFGKYSLVLFVWHTLLFAYFRANAIPPIKIEFINPTLYIIMAASIILFLRLLIEKIKLATLYRNRRLTHEWS